MWGTRSNIMVRQILLKRRRQNDADRYMAARNNNNTHIIIIVVNYCSISNVMTTQLYMWVREGRFNKKKQDNLKWGIWWMGGLLPVADVVVILCAGNTNSDSEGTARGDRCWSFSQTGKDFLIDCNTYTMWGIDRIFCCVYIWWHGEGTGEIGHWCVFSNGGQLESMYKNNSRRRRTSSQKRTQGGAKRTWFLWENIIS